MTQLRGQHGFLSIVVLAIIAVIVLLAIALGYLAGGNTLSSGDRLGSMQALFLAESGLEFEQRRWSQNLDWYRITTDPNIGTATPQTVGAGTFTTYGNVPATMLKSTLSAAGSTINVYTTDRFPTSGVLQIQEDLTTGAEFVRYTGISGTTFTGVTRAQTVGTVVSTVGAHLRGDIAYPVTILRTALLANCTALASIQVDANSKFLSAGTLDVEGEEIGYASASTTGATTTLSGITRCLDLVTPITPAAHAIGQPVTPVLVGGDSADSQVELIATGVQGSNIRYARRTIQR